MLELVATFASVGYCVTLISNALAVVTSDPNDLTAIESAVVPAEPRTKLESTAPNWEINKSSLAASAVCWTWYDSPGPRSNFVAICTNWSESDETHFKYDVFTMSSSFL